jgi:hypothetical protein
VLVLPRSQSRTVAVLILPMVGNRKVEIEMAPTGITSVQGFLNVRQFLRGFLMGQFIHTGTNTGFR